MKVYLLLFCSAYPFFNSIAQKKVLDYSDGESWPVLRADGISNDGKYVIYNRNSGRLGETEIVQAVDHEWKKELSGVVKTNFTPDSKVLIFLTQSDSVGILNLEKDSLYFFDKVKDYKIPSFWGGKWIGCFNKPEKKLCLYNILTKDRRDFSDIIAFSFDDSGKAMALQMVDRDGLTNAQNTLYVNLIDYSTIVVDHNHGASQFQFDEAGAKLCFIANKYNESKNPAALMYYRTGMDKASSIVDSSTEGMKGMTISSDEKLIFSKHGDKILFWIKKYGTTEFVNYSDRVEIKNYKNETLPSTTAVGFHAAVYVNSPAKIVRIEQDTDFIKVRLHIDENGNSQYALIEGISTPRQNVYNPSDWSRRNLYLFSLKDGTRRLISRHSNQYPRFSLTGKYVFWFKRETGQWFTYNIARHHLQNITAKVPAIFYAERDDPKSDRMVEESVAGWLKNDDGILIYDRYDIWLVDPDGIKPPVNVTGGFGKKNKIVLRYIDFSHRYTDEFNSKHPVPISLFDTLLLSGFNVVSKNSGFFSLVLGGKNEMRQLSMGEDPYYFPERYSNGITGICEPIFPLKAAFGNAYMLQRMNTNKYPNLYFTTDFKNFKPLTSLEPEKNYNWYTTDLIHYTLPNGHQSEGILYKPENFNPQKKYPIIFYYYERNADALRFFIYPKLSVGALNIPWFVSNGYLVFVPDILYYKQGYPGECVFQAVNAAANVLVKMPWVDIKKMGLQGHSFGGWETDYIVTRTDRFAAAAPSSGFCDEVSLNVSQYDETHYFEFSQGRIEASFWKQPKLYIENSPIFRADRVTTPLLILNNVKDPRVPFSQGMEWYNGLTRMHKKAWFLAYKNEYHILEDEKDQLDYSIRLSQFFNYYLKDSLPPKWMTYDLHHHDEHSYSGLEYDSTRQVP